MSLPRELKACVSLDLDDKWTYLKIRGIESWQGFPSYLPIVVPRVLRFLAEGSLRITFFIVGQDAAFLRNLPVLRAIADAGHEIGNHSFHHEPWLHLYSRTEIERELDLAEHHIRTVTPRKIHGFRGPGFSFSGTVAEVLAARGYLYDASTLPTFLGPLARAYYLMTAKLSAEERRRRGCLYGRWRDGLLPLKSYTCQTRGGPLLEIPVSTVPLIRTPFHLSYLIYLSAYSERLARAYLRLALTLCRASGVEPSFLLHPLDFLGPDEAPELGFFPGMRVSLQRKLDLADFALASIAESFRIVTLEEQALSTTPRSVAGAPAPSGRCAYVMPVFQAQQDFEETLQSLECSTTPCTVIVVDDGSEPPLRVPGSTRLRIQLIRLPHNRGIVAALNCGFEAALAAGYDYIARIDAGDFSAPERLARQMTYLDDHPYCQLVGSDALVRDENGSYCFTIQPPRDPLDLNDALHERAWLLHPTVMFRASVLREVGLYSHAYHAAEDYEMFLRIAARHEVGVVPEPLLTYVLRRSSISRRNARRQAFNRLRIQLRYFHWARWLSYYGSLRTLGILLIPDWAKHRLKTRFLYCRTASNYAGERQTASANEGGS